MLRDVLIAELNRIGNNIAYTPEDIADKLLIAINMAGLPIRDGFPSDFELRCVSLSKAIEAERMGDDGAIMKRAQAFHDWIKG